MSRNLSPLMRPTSLQPSLTGPRATAAPEVGKPTLVPGRAGFARADAEEAAAPTTPPSRPAAAAPTEPKGTTMAKPKTKREQVLAALEKRTIATVTEIATATKLAKHDVSTALFQMAQAGKVAKSPFTKGEYGVPGAKFTERESGHRATKKPSAPKAKTTTSTKTRNSGAFAAGVAQIEREMSDNAVDRALGIPASNRVSVRGVETPESIAARSAVLIRHEATALPCRAISLASGGAIVLRGNQLTAELDATELEAIHQLRA